ncbi:hypothetical protein bcere0022_33230 [Bacillus cereus Rock3-44]|nr:hypothetical protein bcere0022_33230 [Bacillus cereus Rock3-44]
MRYALFLYKIDSVAVREVYSLQMLAPNIKFGRLLWWKRL